PTRRRRSRTGRPRPAQAPVAIHPGKRPCSSLRMAGGGILTRVGPESKDVYERRRAPVDERMEQRHRLHGSMAAHAMKKAPYLAFALLGVIWGSNFIFMKWAARDISPGQIVLLRVVFGFLPIFLFALAKRALRWEHVRYAHHFVVMSLLATAVY